MATQTTLGRTFGVEIEFVAPPGLTRMDLAERIHNAGIECQSEGQNHHVRTHWKLVRDGSIVGAGCEAVSPVLTWTRGPEEITRVCDMLRNAGCKITTQCGLHVHVGVRQPSTAWTAQMAKRLPLSYARAEKNVIDPWMPPSRRGDSNDFCHSLATRINHAKIMEAATTHDVIAAMRILSSWETSWRSSNRYVKLSMMPVYEYGTIEFRQHAGTLDPVKIIQWVKFCLRFTDAAATYAPSSPIGTRNIAPPLVATPTRPRSGTKRAIMFDMLMSPQGCTTREVLAATGWDQVSVAGTGRQMGLTIRTVRVREAGHSVLRFYAACPTAAAAPVPTIVPVFSGELLPSDLETQNGLFDYLAMPDDEREYWEARRARLHLLEHGAPGAVSGQELQEAFS